MTQHLVETEQLDRERLLEVLRRRETELEGTRKEFEQFAHSVSHDLRAPLRALEGFSQVLVEDYSDKLDGEAKRALEIIAASARKASLLVEDLLVLSRLGRAEMKPGPHKTEDLIKTAMIQLGPDAEHIDWHINPLPESWCDEALLSRVWLELLKNAVKFTRHSEHPRIEISGSTQGGQVVFSVRDNGVGFDQKYAGRLFSVFQRLHTETEFPGRGIGLAIVARLVRRHGGEVWAEAKTGQGASFFFSLPLPDNDATSHVLPMSFSP